MDLRLYLELPWPQTAVLPKTPSRQDINLFFKYYDPLQETLKYVGHLYVPKTFQVRPSARRSGVGGWGDRLLCCSWCACPALQDFFVWVGLYRGRAAAGGGGPTLVAELSVVLDVRHQQLVQSAVLWLSRGSPPPLRAQHQLGDGRPRVVPLRGAAHNSLQASLKLRTQNSIFECVTLCCDGSVGCVLLLMLLLLHCHLFCCCCCCWPAPGA
jgi:hypothetical protein